MWSTSKATSTTWQVLFWANVRVFSCEHNLSHFANNDYSPVLSTKFDQTLNKSKSDILTRWKYFQQCDQNEIVNVEKVDLSYNTWRCVVLFLGDTDLSYHRRCLIIYGSWPRMITLVTGKLFWIPRSKILLKMESCWISRSWEPIRKEWSSFLRRILSCMIFVSNLHLIYIWIHVLFCFLKLVFKFSSWYDVSHYSCLFQFG